jgi:diphosphomevalonate decarboxylase
MVSRARACANIALVKYWGKRDEVLNLPAKGSLSMTLDALSTTTSVEILSEGVATDQLILDGREDSGKKLQRVVRFLDLVRATAGSKARARVVSANDFPTAAGLASSASAFAALAVAASNAYGLALDPRALSILARRGSGSAARSIFGGFVRMHAGTRADGTDAYAEPISGAKLELGAVIAVARATEKKIGSTEGMERTRQTSPYHAAWLDQVDRDLEGAEEALAAGDIERLAEIAEGSCLAMHADALAARPGIVYFGTPTLWAIEVVRSLRAQGTPVFFTIDAGPHLVAFAPPAHLEAIARALAAHPEIDRTPISRVGAGASLG